MIKGTAQEYNNMKDSESRPADSCSTINTTLFPVGAQIIHCKYSRTRKNKLAYTVASSLLFVLCFLYFWSSHV